MPALDPFSAASKPMLPFDNLPSRPLPFAATLHPIDLNSPNVTSSKILPKPRIHKESNPKHFPSPQYSHSRHVSSTSLNEVLGKPVVIGSDDWMQSEVAKCVDSASGNLTIA